MTNIILTTPEELRAIVSETVSQSLAGFTQPRNEPDNLTPDVAVEVLERRFSDFKGTALQADRQKGSAVPQIREQIAFLTERASHVGGKPCKKGKRQGRGGTRHRQERKPENP